jgi:hypothetical protein
MAAKIENLVVGAGISGDVYLLRRLGDYQYCDIGTEPFGEISK